MEKPQDGRLKSCPNIGNLYQMEDNKAAPSAPPPLGVVVPFGKDFLSFASFPGPILGQLSEFGPGRDLDPSRISNRILGGSYQPHPVEVDFRNLSV